METLKEEFAWKRFALRFYKAEAFCEAQWQWPRLVFVLYRLVMFTYSVFAFTQLMVATNPTPRIMAFLTVWTYIVEVLYFFTGSALAVFYFFHPDHFRQTTAGPSRGRVNRACHESDSIDRGLNVAHNESVGNSNGTTSYGTAPVVGVRISPAESPRMIEAPVNKPSVENTHSNSFIRFDVANPHVVPISSPQEAQTDVIGCDDWLPWYIKVHWCIGNVIFVFALVVTSVYFGALYRASNGSIPLDDVNVHAVNSVMIMIDVAVCAMPIRLLHVLFPVLYGILYVIFSAIYWSRDPANNVLYPNVLDWNHPGSTMGVILGLAFIGVPFLQLVFFAVYRLRLAVYYKVYGELYL